MYTPNSTSVNGVCPVCNGNRIIPMFTVLDETNNKEKWRLDGLLTHDGVLITDIDQTIFSVSVNGLVCEALTLRIIYLAKKYIKGEYRFFSTNEAREKWVGYMKEIKSTDNTPTERPEVENRLDIITEDGVVNPKDVYIVFILEVDLIGKSAHIRKISAEHYSKLASEYIAHKIFSSKLLAINYINSRTSTNTKIVDKEPELSNTEIAGMAALMDMAFRYGPVDGDKFAWLTKDGVMVKDPSQIIYGLHKDDTTCSVSLLDAYVLEEMSANESPIYFSTREALDEYIKNRNLNKNQKIEPLLKSLIPIFNDIVRQLRSQGV